MVDTSGFKPIVALARGDGNCSPVCMMVDLRNEFYVKARARQDATELRIIFSDYMKANPEIVGFGTELAAAHFDEIREEGTYFEH